LADEPTTQQRWPTSTSPTKNLVEGGGRALPSTNDGTSSIKGFSSIVGASK